MFRLLTISLAIVGGCGGQVTEDTPPASQWQRIDTIKTQPVPVVPEIVKPITGSDYYVVKWTAKNCPPCIQWDRSERAKLTAAGIEVVDIDCGNPANAATLKSTASEAGRNSISVGVRRRN
jgi:hypothetical protein